MKLPGQMYSAGHYAAPPAAHSATAQVSPAQVAVDNPAWVQPNLRRPLGTCYINDNRDCRSGRIAQNVDRHTCCYQMLAYGHQTNGTSWRSNNDGICSICDVRSSLHRRQARGNQS